MRKYNVLSDIGNEYSSLMRTRPGQLSLLEKAREENPGLRDEHLVRGIAATTIAELAEEPPVDLDVVAGSRGIDDIRIEDLDVAGSLTPQSEGLVMRLRRTDSAARRRFTGFHEVTHTFQPGYYEREVRRCDADDLPSWAEVDEEALCDIGAAELLMPEQFVREDLRAADFGIQTAMALGKRYMSSVEASCHRLSALWPEPTLTVVLEPGLRKAERGQPEAVPKLRVKHAHASGGHWPFIPRNKSVADDSPLVRAFKLDGQAVGGKATLEDLARESPTGLEVSAQGFSYRRSDGRERRRVIALYRQKRTQRST